jgi:GNAT superfamily N-acetyltransferase
MVMVMSSSELCEVQITGYFPGVIGMITELHATYYYENWGFDLTFETQVGRELSEFMMDFQDSRDGLWIATINGEFAGSIAIDGRQSRKEGARLRWFIVHPQFQCKGIGGSLIEEAVDFCRKEGHSKAFLWTFEGLDAACSLYERVGFRLCKEHEVYQWGQNIKEQMFELNP